MSTAVKIKQNEEATLDLDGQQISLPIIQGTEGERAIDISTLRRDTGYVTLDEGFVNTASCRSDITFLDGEKGILRYRGHAIEDLAKHYDFLEVAYLLIYESLPNKSQWQSFQQIVADHSKLQPGVEKIIQCFPKDAHPMAVLSAAIVGMSGFHQNFLDPELSLEEERVVVAQLLGQLPAIAAAFYAQSHGREAKPSQFPEQNYCADFLWQMSGKKSDEVFSKALTVLLNLHADHEQNCSTSTVRLVGSSKANLYASISAGINALWGPLHGGANQAVMEMLQQIADDGGDYSKFIAKAKDKNDPFKLMGFGHRVYKNFDPRASLIKQYCDDVFAKLGHRDPLLDVALGLEKTALSDPYFIDRKLFPNVDFYSGILYKAMDIPTNMFTVMFALGRLPGWIAQWREMRNSDAFRIGRPRQIYTGK